jgi:hypothetical protein
MSIDFTTSILGTTEGALDLGSSDDHRDAAIALAQQATRSLHIYSYELDHRVYDHKPFIEALTKVALHAPQCKVLILVRDTNHMIHYGHRIIEAMRRIPSRIQMRKLHPDYYHYTEEFAVADEIGVLLRRSPERYDGSVNFNAKKEARERVKLFNEVWRPSEPEPRLKHLSI